jgi:hypothetical protein
MCDHPHATASAIFSNAQDDFALVGIEDDVAR